MQKQWLMEMLDLSRLNVLSPYSFWYIGKNTYSFLVKRGGKSVTYRVGFAPNESVWENGAYEFFITNDSHEPSPSDPKLKESIIAIIQEFFRENPDVLLYQCDTSENKQAMRARLFTRWYNTYEFKDRHCVKMIKFMDDDVENYAALIIEKSNPNCERLLSEFEAYTKEMMEKPQY